MLKHFLTCLALLTVGCPAMAQPVSDCSSSQGRVQVVARAKASVAGLSNLLDRQQAQLEAETGQTAARTRWSDQQRIAFFRGVFQAKQHTDFDKQIGLLTAEMRTMLPALQRGEAAAATSDCRLAVRLQELVKQLESVYKQQSSYVIARLRSVKAAPAP